MKIEKSVVAVSGFPKRVSEMVQELENSGYPCIGVSTETSAEPLLEIPDLHPHLQAIIIYSNSIKEELAETLPTLREKTKAPVLVVKIGRSSTPPLAADLLGQGADHVFERSADIQPAEVIKELEYMLYEKSTEEAPPARPAPQTGKKPPKNREWHHTSAAQLQKAQAAKERIDGSKIFSFEETGEYSARGSLCGKEFRLTIKEAKLFAAICAGNGTIVSKEDLLHATGCGSLAVLRVAIHNLRKNLAEISPHCRKIIINKPDRGFYLNFSALPPSPSQ